MPKQKWTFITNHGTVLAYIANHQQPRGVDIATALGLTERSVRRIIDDLEAGGYIRKKRIGWFNRYEVNATMPLRRQGSGDVTVGELLGVLLRDKRRQQRC